MNQAPLTAFQKLRQNIFWEYGEAIICALGLAFILTTFIVQAFKIPSASMLETLQIGDHLLVNKFIYGLKKPFSDTYLIKGFDPAIGDVVVFRYPKDPSLDYIKRIVGIPGDVLEMKNKILIRNGQPIQEDYVRLAQPNTMLTGRDNWGPITVPPDKYFTLGDNRDESSDSRFWGFVDRQAIRGKAWRIYWSSVGLSSFKLDRIGKAVN